MEEILAKDVVAELGKVLLEVSHTLTVDFHSLHLARLLHKILRQHTHAGTNLQDGNGGAGINGVGYAARDVEIGEEMLSKILFRSYSFYHISLIFCKDSSKERDDKEKKPILTDKVRKKRKIFCFFF